MPNPLQFGFLKSFSTREKVATKDIWENLAAVSLTCQKFLTLFHKKSHLK